MNKEEKAIRKKKLKELDMKIRNNMKLKNDMINSSMEHLNDMNITKGIVKSKKWGFITFILILITVILYFIISAK